MFQSLLEAVRAEVSGARALDTVRSLARHHRVQASPGYDEAASWLAGRLEASGLSVATEHVPGDGRTRCLGALMPRGWDCARATATLLAGATREPLCDYAAERLSLVLRSAPARGRFPLVAVDDGTDESHYGGVDVRGAIVLTRGAAHRAHRLAVVARGAAGVLCDGRRSLPPVRDAYDDPDALAYTSFWWNEDEPRGWGFVVSPRAGARLRDRLRAGERLALEVEIDSRDFETRIPLLSATTPGPGGQEPDAREALVVSHLCHPMPSANDNASGVAAALEAARALAALAERRQWSPGAGRVRFLFVPELTGTFAWLARDAARPRRIAAAVNLDMVGQDQDACGSTFLLEHPPYFAASFAEELLRRIRHRALDWVASYSGPGHYSLTRMSEVPYSGGSDHAVLIDPEIGVPCPMLIQWPDRYYHSSHDTPDRCDPGSLALAARCAATYSGFVASAGPAEVGWLIEAVGRGARRRILDALDADDAGRAFERERLRARQALASLARLGAAERDIEDGLRAVETFAEREGARSPETRFPTAGPSRSRPRRAVGAPLDPQRHLLSGYARLEPAGRRAWRDLERAVPGGSTTLELAWYACDGRRTLADIARMVWLETGTVVAPEDAPAGSRSLRDFFERAESLGLCAWAGEVEP
jgi:hypothetical protein